ncbi:unnamed protein product [Clonostachys rosea]|uniref:DUF7730 domain-containing protein n=1 Tax=Bionectria ochroleuca TaxID=29856 RepID=A0ABY6V4R2_BIOOC|nr:unnamed protein product [Clonostachys rosea]
MDLNQSSLSFLSLPYHVRKRIYVFADLVRDCPISIVLPALETISPTTSSPPGFPPAPPGVPPPNALGPNLGAECRFRMLQRGQDRSVFASYAECICPEIPRQLLRISKALHTEISEIIYGENKFVIRAQKVEDLGVFNIISDAAVSQLRWLMIRLNSWPCYRGHSSLMPVAPPRCKTCSASIDTADPELIDGQAQSKAMIQGWASLCNRLASCVPPGRLELEFVCDVGDMRSAEQIIKPLDSLPRLKKCAIRLGRRRNHGLETLARSTSLRLTAQYNHHAELGSSHFPFFRLPQEIRRHILALTDLDPSNVNGEHRHSFTIKVGKWDPSNDCYSVVPKRICCHHCSFTKRDCSCTSDYASYSPGCQCRVLPLNLFLVSRQMYAEAADVLYTANIFTFVGPFEETLRCLQALQSTTLSSFRRIRFLFDADQSFRYYRHEEAWACLLSFIAEKFDLSSLLVTIDTSRDTLQCMQSDYEEWILHDLYKAYISAVTLAKSMLPGLHGFHVFLGAFFDLEPVLERFVMGPGYNIARVSEGEGEGGVVAEAGEVIEGEAEAEVEVEVEEEVGLLRG